jgi:hypothetical protein
MYGSQAEIFCYEYDKPKHSGIPPQAKLTQLASLAADIFRLPLGSVREQLL